MKCRGILVTFEGIAHTGKTECARRLARELSSHGMRTEFVVFPKACAILSAYLRGECDLTAEESFSLLAQNQQEHSKEIYEHLREGVNVIVERYPYTSIAHAVSLDPINLSFDKCVALTPKLPKPDLVCYMFPSQCRVRDAKERVLVESILNNFNRFQGNDCPWMVVNNGAGARFKEANYLAIRDAVFSLVEHQQDPVHSQEVEDLVLVA